MHICCAPCAILPCLDLRKSYDITGLFFNPNIHPYKEYLDRLGSVLELSKELDIRILEDSYPYHEFLAKTVQDTEEPNRCLVCYQMRISRLKEWADKMDFELATTSLLYSIYQKHDMLRSVADQTFEPDRFLTIDYRKDFYQGVSEAKARNYYRQKYCGCLFSHFERYHAPPK